MSEQYVCLECGYNMVGYHPERCPFCGAPKERFITAEECTERFAVRGTPVNDHVTRLNSVPALGYEHAAYRIRSGGRTLWVDCPSCFDPRAGSMDAIIFTHPHFLGASNLYRERHRAKVAIHEADTANPLCRGFTFDRPFADGHEDSGLRGMHIDGHTPGFNAYLYGDVLFACDYVFWNGERMKHNPFGPQDATEAGGRRLRGLIEGRDIATVCGVDYVEGFERWWEHFEQLSR